MIEILFNHPRVRSTMRNDAGHTAEDIFAERHGEHAAPRPQSGRATMRDPLGGGNGNGEIWH